MESITTGLALFVFAWIVSSVFPRHAEQGTHPYMTDAAVRIPVVVDTTHAAYTDTRGQTTPLRQIDTASYEPPTEDTHRAADVVVNPSTETLLEILRYSPIMLMDVSVGFYSDHVEVENVLRQMGRRIDHTAGYPLDAEVHARDGEFVLTLSQPDAWQGTYVVRANDIVSSSITVLDDTLAPVKKGSVVVEEVFDPTLTSPVPKAEVIPKPEEVFAALEIVVAEDVVEQVDVAAVDTVDRIVEVDTESVLDVTETEEPTAQSTITVIEEERPYAERSTELTEPTVVQVVDEEGEKTDEVTAAVEVEAGEQADETIDTVADAEALTLTVDATTDTVAEVTADEETVTDTATTDLVESDVPAYIDIEIDDSAYLEPEAPTSDLVALHNTETDPSIDDPVDVVDSTSDTDNITDTDAEIEADINDTLSEPIVEEVVELKNPALCSAVLQPPSLRVAVNAYLECVGSHMRIAPREANDPADWTFSKPIDITPYTEWEWRRALEMHFGVRFIQMDTDGT